MAAVVYGQLLAAHVTERKAELIQPMFCQYGDVLILASLMALYTPPRADYGMTLICSSGK